MNKIHNLSKFVGVFGAIILVSSIARWYFIYPDLSNALFGVGIGGLLIILAYIYNFMRNVDEDISELNKRIDSVVSLWFHLEEEDVKRQAIGKKEVEDNG